MDSVLSFLIKLQANADNVVSVAHNTMSQLDSISNKARSTGSRLREAFSFSNFKSSLMSIPGMEFLTNPYTLAAGAIGAITKVGAEAEQTSVAFTTLVGSESRAKDMLGQITDFANKSPFGKLDLTKNAQTMLNFGVATDQVLPRLKQLGDISGGNKERLQSLSLVYGQVTAAGKLQGQDLLQFVGAGFNPLKELQAMTGKSYQELQEMMGKGQITAEAVGQAMEHATSAGGKFYGMMGKQSQTVIGKFSTLMDLVREKAVNMFDKIKSPIGDLLDMAIAGLPKIMTLIESLFGTVVNAIKFVVRFRTEFLAVGVAIGTVWGIFKAYTVALQIYKTVQTGIIFATKAWAIVQTLLNAAFVASPIGWITLGIAALAAGVLYCWNKFAGFRAFIYTVWDTMIGFGNIIKTYVINRIDELLSGVGKLGEALKRLFSGDFKGAASSALEGYKKLSGVGSGVNAIGSTKNLINGISSNYATKLANESKSNKAVIKTKQPKSETNSIVAANKTQAITFGKPKADKGKKGTSRSTSGRKSAEEIATGGTRNTSINMTIAKFFDNINVYMNDKTDTAQLEQIVLQSLNRALAIATSTER